MDTLIEELKQNLEQKENFKSSMYEGMENSPLVSDQKHKLKEFDTNIAHAEEWIRRYQKSNEALLYNIQKLKDMLDGRKPWTYTADRIRHNRYERTSGTSEQSE